MSKVGHLPLFERVPAASVVRANLVSQVILIFRVNQATQLLFSIEFSYWPILILLLFISLINIWIGRLRRLSFEYPGSAGAGPRHFIAKKEKKNKKKDHALHFISSLFSFLSSFWVFLSTFWVCLYFTTLTVVKRPALFCRIALFGFDVSVRLDPGYGLSARILHTRCWILCRASLQEARAAN